MQYNIALTLFFVPYAFFEVPSQIVLKLVRPSIWISILMFSWGTVMTLMGVISSYQGLLITRFFLGVAEAGFFRMYCPARKCALAYNHMFILFFGDTQFTDTLQLPRPIS
jgi:hypothetical protein